MSQMDKGQSDPLLHGYSRSTSDTSKGPTQAIILAAGRGSRLKDETRNRPKCLAEVDCLPLIEHQLQCLSKVGIESVFVVAGYLAGQVAKAVQGRAAVIQNCDWATSNSLYSLWLCRHWVTGPAIILNCDVLAHPDVLHRLVGAGADTFAYDSTSGSAEEEMKVRLRGGHLTEMSKALSPKHSHGENVGILHFDKGTMSALFREAEQVLATQGHLVWLASAVERVARDVRLQGIDVSDLPWVEIDFPDDLRLAREETWPAIAQLMPRGGLPEIPQLASLGD